MNHPARASGKLLLRLGAVLLGGIAAGFLLLLAVYALPVEPIARNVQLSVPALDGSWETGEIAYEQLVKGYQSTQLDNSTDGVMMLAAACKTDGSLLRRAVNVPSLTYGSSGYAALLEYGQNGQTRMKVTTSARYWLGFLIFLKPLLSFMSYLDIRILLMIVEQLLLAAVLVGFCRRGLARFTPAFALALLCVTPAIIGFSLQFSTVYLLFLTAMLVLLYAPKATRTKASAATFFLIVGMATSYFDYLTYPLATFGMPFVLLLLLRPASARRETLLCALGCLGAWLGGYFGMWAGKWVLAALLGGDTGFLAGLTSKITERGSYVSDGAAIRIADVYRAVLGVFAKRAYLLAAAVIAAGYAALLARARLRHVRQVPPRRDGLVLTLIGTALLPLGWYALTANHTYNHAFFTSRALVVTAFATLTLMTLPFRAKPDIQAVGK